LRLTFQAERPGKSSRATGHVPFVRVHFALQGGPGQCSEMNFVLRARVSAP
jgi:hypothetical protein